MDVYIWLGLNFLAVLAASQVSYLQGFTKESNALDRCDDGGGSCSDILFGEAGKFYGVPLSFLGLSTSITIIITFISVPDTSSFVFLVSLASGLMSAWLILSQIRSRKFCSLCNHYHLANIFAAILSARIINAVPGVEQTGALMLALVCGSFTLCLLILFQKMSDKIYQLEERVSFLTAISSFIDLPKLSSELSYNGVIENLTNVVSLPAAVAPSKGRLTIVLSLDCEMCRETLKVVFNDAKMAEVRNLWDLELSIVTKQGDDPIFPTIIAAILQHHPSEGPKGVTSFLRLVLRQLPAIDAGGTSRRRAIAHLGLDRITDVDAMIDRAKVKNITFLPSICVNGTVLPKAINDAGGILHLIGQKQTVEGA